MTTTATSTANATVERDATPSPTVEHCPCGNAVESEGLTLCDYCDFAASEPPHELRGTLFGDTWCVTCSSNYCDLI